MAHAIIFVDWAPQVNQLDFQSPQYGYTAGAYKIASVLRAQGLDVLVVPNCLNLSYFGITELIKQNSNNLLWVGLSTTFMITQAAQKDVDQYRESWIHSKSPMIDLSPLLNNDIDAYQSYQLIWDVKNLSRLAFFLDKNYSVPLIVGGANSNRIEDHRLRHPNLHLVNGYAENFIKELTSRQLKNNKSVPYIIDNKEYDDHEFKTSTIIWKQHDLIDANDWLPLEVSRGCAFDCAYCNYSRKSTFDSFKNPKALREELIRNYETFGVTKYVLIDDLYNDSKNKVRELYDQTWSKLPFKPEWVSYMRLDMFWSDPESAEIIKASGARCGGFGVETLHDQAGRKVGKGLGKARTLETLEMLNKIWKDDVLIAAYFIAGLPMEPEESIQETLDWAANTDLVHGYVWNPMYLTRPSTLALSTKNRIDSDFDKFGVRWLSDTNWINSAGMTLERAQQLINQSQPQYPKKKYFTFVDYANFRVAGFDHTTIAGIRNGAIQETELQQGASVFQNKVQQRLQKLLTIAL